MRYFITGCAGFIGSNLVERLLIDGHSIVGYDNLSTGQLHFLEQSRHNSNFNFIRGDTLNITNLTASMEGCDFVFHLAANADVRFGTKHPRKDLEQNTIATSNVLEAMRIHKIYKIAFSSSGSVYGNPNIFPTPENAPFPSQTSFYGASKLACEALIQAYCEGFDFQSYIFRFVSILGEKYSHGHVFDFYRALRHNPEELYVLGDGTQRKSYLYVQDCIDAMLLAIEKSDKNINIFNLGTDEHCQVNDSIQWIIDYLRLAPRLIYSGGKSGWIGDSPYIFLDCSGIRALGWNPKLDIYEGVIRTLRYLQKNQWVLSVAQ